MSPIAGSVVTDASDRTERPAGAPDDETTPTTPGNARAQFIHGDIAEPKALLPHDAPRQLLYAGQCDREALDAWRHAVESEPELWEDLPIRVKGKCNLLQHKEDTMDWVQRLRCLGPEGRRVVRKSGVVVVAGTGKIGYHGHRHRRTCVNNPFFWDAKAKQLRSKYWRLAESRDNMRHYLERLQRMGPLGRRLADQSRLYISRPPHSRIEYYQGDQTLPDVDEPVFWKAKEMELRSKYRYCQSKSRLPPPPRWWLRPAANTPVLEKAGLTRPPSPEPCFSAWPVSDEEMASGSVSIAAEAADIAQEGNACAGVA